MRYSLTLLFSLLTHISLAQRIGGGELNPGLYTNPAALARFQQARVGVSIHWGPNSLGGQEISWSRGKETPKEVYDAYYKQFNPTRYNATEWVKLFNDFGARYVVFTSKHHDGFSMWHSAYSDYDVASTPFKRDILKELSVACERQNLIFGTYYSTLDWYHPDYKPYGHGGPGELFPKQPDSPNLNRYWIHARNQLRELITTYKTQIIQFDGDWDSTWTHEVGSHMYVYLRKLNDNLLINNRTDKGRYPPPPHKTKGPWRADLFAGDFEERERITTNFETVQPDVLGKSAYPWQAWVTLDRSQWSWKQSFKFLGAEELVIDLLRTVGDGGNYLINVGPRPDGSFEPAAEATLREAGKWVRRYATAIYGTEGGPFVQEGQYTSTRKGHQVYLFVYDPTLRELTLPVGQMQVKSIRDEQQRPVAFRQAGTQLQVSLEAGTSFLRNITIELK
jgi:alpha-L-fucosidase